MKIAGLVILYNPDYEVVDNIKSYCTQVDVLYVFDNSTVKNESIIKQLKEFSNIEYVTLGVNMGIAKPYNIICKKAIEDGCKYILTMDDDSKAPENMVVALQKCFVDNKTAIVSPWHIKKYNNLKKDNGISEEYVVLASGNLLDLDAYKEIGPFDEKYFIDFVDVEYCLRARLKGYRVLSNNEIELIHNEGNLQQKKFFGKIVYPYNHSPIRWFYKTRNLLLLIKDYKKEFPEFINCYYKLFGNEVLKIILFEHHKMLKIQYIIKGAWAYYKNSFGRYNG